MVGSCSFRVLEMWRSVCTVWPDNSTIQKWLRYGTSCGWIVNWAMEHLVMDSAHKYFAQVRGQLRPNWALQKLNVNVNVTGGLSYRRSRLHLRFRVMQLNWGESHAIWLFYIQTTGMTQYPNSNLINLITWTWKLYIILKSICKICFYMICKLVLTMFCMKCIATCYYTGNWTIFSITYKLYYLVIMARAIHVQM